MSDLLEALKDTNRLIEAILRINNIGHCSTETISETRAQAALLTDRIIEASRQAGAVGAKDQANAVVNGCTVERMRNHMERALDNLERIPDPHPSSNVAYAILHLKAGLEGGAA